VYSIQAVTFTTDLSQPQLAVAKTVRDLNGGDVEPGDVLRYAVTTRNDGDDAALRGERARRGAGRDRARARLLDGPGGAAAADARSVAWSAGTLAPTAATTTGFDVRVNLDLDDGFVMDNIASASGTGASAGRAVSGASPAANSMVHVPPVLATLEVTPETPTAGEAAVAAITFQHHRGADRGRRRAGRRARRRCPLRHDRGRREVHGAGCRALCARDARAGRAGHRPRALPAGRRGRAPAGRRRCAATGSPSRPAEWDR